MKTCACNVVKLIKHLIKYTPVPRGNMVCFLSFFLFDKMFQKNDVIHCILSN